MSKSFIRSFVRTYSQIAVKLKSKELWSGSNNFAQDFKFAFWIPNIIQYTILSIVYTIMVWQKVIEIPYFRSYRWKSYTVFRLNIIFIWFLISNKIVVQQMNFIEHVSQAFYSRIFCHQLFWIAVSQDQTTIHKLKILVHCLDPILLTFLIVSIIQRNWNRKYYHSVGIWSLNIPESISLNL